jgi:intracellular septation protein
MGAVNLAAVHNLSCNAWVNFKFYGFTALMLAFVFAQSVMLAKHVEATEESR